MSSKTVLILCVLCAALTLGCSRSSKNENTTGANGNRPATATTSSTASNAEAIGVAECDDFIAKYEACISDHIPEAQKRQYRENIDAWRKSWRQLVTGNQMSKEAMAATCKRHILQSREGMKSFGCEF